VPGFTVEFREFANANSFIRLESGWIEVRLTDVLHDAPAPILEALAYILICKLYRRPVPRACNHRYRLYLNRKDVRQTLQRYRRERGRKHVSDARGDVYDLEELFEKLNLRYFNGLMARPDLGWSLRPSRTTLGHYDPSHHIIVLSKILDRKEVALVVVEYVMFHEMLHLRYPVEHRGVRRCVHTPEFKLAEKQFEGLKEAKDLLRKL
jgi:predicted metal-dependent hydrolase